MASSEATRHRARTQPRVASNSPRGPPVAIASAPPRSRSHHRNPLSHHQPKDGFNMKLSLEQLEALADTGPHAEDCPCTWCRGYDPNEDDQPDDWAWTASLAEVHQ